MKFGKELSSQRVQEWREAYMNYDNLKLILKDISNFRQQKNITSSSPSSGPTSRTGSLKRRLTMYRAFSGLTGRSTKTDDEVILVGALHQDGSENGYQTMFLRSSDEGGEYELVFFRRLDKEFNKVLKFYKKKVNEVELEADELSKQMDALIALRIKVEKPRIVEEVGVSSRSGSSSPATVVASVNGVKQGVRRMDIIDEVEMSSCEREEMIKSKHVKKNEHFRPAPLEVLSHVQINVDPETPISTLKNVIMSSRSNLSFSREELRKAEEKLRNAFIEFYQQLRLLKSYCFMNMLAFSKIMKKYDKITSRTASKSYLDMVDKSYLGSSDEVNKLIERLEGTFIKYFSNGNRRKGMKSLKPKHKKERHRTTFFLGLFTGCTIALVIAILVSVHARSLVNTDPSEREKYMQNIFPLYSLFGFIILHMIMYGANTYYWRRFSVNYPFIFNFKPGTELGFREIFLVASGFSVISLAAVLSNLDMEMDKRTQKYQVLTELVPLGLLSLVTFLTFCPFNIIYRSSRFFLIQSAWHCICAPLYKVSLTDFFLADQLTSQIQTFRSLQFFACYYVWGDFTTRSNKCLKSRVEEIVYIIIAVIPFWMRVLQCLRRMFEEKDLWQGLNGLKYFSTIVALVIRTLYVLRTQNGLRKEPFLQFLAFLTSGITTIYNTYWDIVIDWGLLRRNARNPWLREKLLVPNKAVYFVAIVVNILLRLVWMQLVLNWKLGFLHDTATVALVACLEILRRGIWNFFRLENEHLNNVGKYRAFKSVPLPFHYSDEKIM